MKTHKQAQNTNSEIGHIQTLRDMAKALKHRLDKLENEIRIKHGPRVELNALIKTMTFNELNSVAGYFIDELEGSELNMHIFCSGVIFWLRGWECNSICGKHFHFSKKLINFS